MKLEADGVGLHRPARQPRPPDRILTLSDPLLRRAALIVKGEHPLGWAAQVRDQKAHPGIEFTRMPLHLGHDPARVAPALGLVAEAGVETADVVGWAAHRTCEQVR